MKNLTVMTLILVAVVFSACATKASSSKVDNSYERANKASSESLRGLDRE